MYYITEKSIVGDLVGEGDTVLLVMPQDAQAPKGRLILPQVTTLRELLDKHCIITSCATEEIDDALLSMEVGETRTVDFVVPERMLGFENYRGDTLYATITPTAIVCRFKLTIADSGINNLKRRAFDEMWRYYSSNYYSSIVSETIRNYDELLAETDKDRYEKNLAKVRKYYNEYFSENDISRDIFISEYSGITEEDMEYTESVLALSSSRLDKARKKLADNKQEARRIFASKLSDD